MLLQTRGANMYAKFPYYSVAQMYAFNLNQPVAILLGNDHLYWVVDPKATEDLMDTGCSMLYNSN